MRRLPHRVGAVTRCESVIDAVCDWHAEDIDPRGSDEPTKTPSVCPAASLISIVNLAKIPAMPLTRNRPASSSTPPCAATFLIVLALSGFLVQRTPRRGV